MSSEEWVRGIKTLVRNQRHSQKITNINGSFIVNIGIFDHFKRGTVPHLPE